MSAVGVRPARADDARAVAEIHVRTWQAAYVGLVPAAYLATLDVSRHEAMWRGRIEGGTPLLQVATDADGALLGWIAFDASRDPAAAPGVAEIWALYVGAAHWGRGVGRALWLGAREALRARGYASVELWAFPQNVRAVRFYGAIGFAVEPESAKQFELGGARLDEVRFVRTLEVD